MAARYPALDLWAAGFSFGAWIALTVGAEDDRVSTLIAIAPPADRYDFADVASSPKAKFLVLGERDDIAPLPAARTLYARMIEPKELVVIDAADHLFDGKTTEVGDALADLLEDFGR
jgi:alpha/beta superfamily hydrolase